MTTDLWLLAQEGDSLFVFPWYSWVGLGLIIVILIVYKIYKNKTMG